MSYRRYKNAEDLIKGETVFLKDDTEVKVLSVRPLEDNLKPDHAVDVVEVRLNNSMQFFCPAKRQVYYRPNTPH